MSKQPLLSEQERADLVAYLDGELGGEAARAMERKLSLNPAIRAEADALKRTWELLDFLPRPEPSPSFTEKTISKLVPVSRGDGTPSPGARNWRQVALGAGWVASLMLSSLIGYHVYQRLSPWEPGEKELVRDLRLIENKQFYDLVDDMEFLRQLDQPDLFGDSTGN